MAKRKKKSNNDLNTENEFLKLKMMAEFGGEFMGSDQLPPAVENVFLKQINKFQSLHQKAEMVKIFEFIGSPAYNHVHDLSDKEILRDLKKIQKILQKKGIIVESFSGISPREMYRFIIEEIFKQDIQNIKMPNWLMHMVYEEFHPSDEFDIKNQCGYALALLFDTHFSATDFIFAEEMKSDIGLSIDREEIIQKIDTFKVGYNQLEFVGAEFKQIDMTEDKSSAHVQALVDFRTQTQKGRRFKSEQEEIQFTLIKDPDTGMWVVEQIVFNRL